MTFVSNVTNILQRVTLPGNMGEKIQNGFLGLEKAEASALWVPESSVIVGRSAAAYERGGFMEFQERGPEEIAVAVLWIHGVNWMRKQFNRLLAPAVKPPDDASMQKKLLYRLKVGFDKVKPGFMKNINPDFVDIAWKPFGKHGQDDLLAAERYTRNAAEMRKLWPSKMVRLASSVGLTMIGVALVIPWLNQKKTEWILKRQKEKKQSGETVASVPLQPSRAMEARPIASVSAPSRSSRMIHPAARPAVSNNVPAIGPSWPQAHPPGAWPQLSPLYQQPVAGMPTYGHPVQHQAPRFGFIGKMAQALGHGVEQTTYGSVLAVDTGITGGRAVVAGQRSIFETVEIVFRDGVSLYFYILCAPQVVKALAKMLDGRLQTSLALEPHVAKQLQQKLAVNLARIAAEDPVLAALVTDNTLSAEQIQKMLLEKTTPEAMGKILRKIPLEEARRVLLGLDSTDVKVAQGVLAKELRTASMENFSRLLQKEAAAYQTGSHGLVQSYLKSHLGVRDTLSREALQELLTDIEKGKGPFKSIADAERTNLTTAIKQAFRHTVGVQLDLSASALEDIVLRQMSQGLGEPIADMSKLRNEIQKLSLTEQKKLVERIRSMAAQDGLDQFNTMFRRSINMVTELGQNDALSATLEEQSRLVDKAVNRGMSLTEVLQAELEDIKSALQKAKLTGLTDQHLQALDQAEPQGLRQLEKWLSPLTGGKVEKAKERLALLNQALDGSRDLKAAVLKSLDDIVGKETGIERQALLEAYVPEMRNLLEGKTGRLFSMIIDAKDERFTYKLKGLLQGGVSHDDRQLRDALNTVGQLKDSSRHHMSGDKFKDMQKALFKYAESLLDSLKQTGAIDDGSGKLLAKDGLKFLEGFRIRNQVAHYTAKTLGLVTAMFFLGYAIPKMQYALTRKLTGRDTHPGIENAAKKQGLNNGSPEVKHSLPSDPNYVPLNRNNFSAFKIRPTA